MEKKKSTHGEILVATILGALLFLVVVCIIMLQLFGSVKKANSATKESLPKETVSTEEIVEEDETPTELALEGFSVGSVISTSQEAAPTEVPAVSPTPDPLVVAGGEYLIADSNTRLITEVDLDLLSKEDVSRARNEIYARYGRMFDDVELQTYFESKSWYVSQYSADEFPEDLLNEIEKANAKFIRQYEEEKGYK